MTLTYAELQRRSDAPVGSSWGLFGANDEVGTLNFLTEQCVVDAVSHVRRGVIFNLDCPVDCFDPPMSKSRKAATHTIYQNHVAQYDDWLDGYYLQSGTHIDGLRHMRHPVHGFYNGLCHEGRSADDPTLGIGRWAEKGIVGRGIVVDVGRSEPDLYQSTETGAGRQSIDVAAIEATLTRQGTTVKSGDVLLLRTGWFERYQQQRTSSDTTSGAVDLTSPGLEQSHDILEWLWDNQISMVAADNPALEAWPPEPASPFRDASDKGPPGWMHPTMIALLGLAVGELWNLDALAADCAETGVYEAMIVASPLNLTGGVGSPANAVALK